MKRFKEADYYDHPTYNNESDTLIGHCRILVEELQSLLAQKNLDGIALQEERLLLSRDGEWEVQTKSGSTRLPSSTEIDVVMGYWLAPSDDQEPDSFFFRLTPDVKRTQACQLFQRLLEVRISEVSAADFLR